MTAYEAREIIFGGLFVIFIVATLITHEGKMHGLEDLFGFLTCASFVFLVMNSIGWHCEHDAAIADRRQSRHCYSRDKDMIVITDRATGQELYYEDEDGQVLFCIGKEGA